MSIPIPSRIKENPDYQDLSFEKRNDFVDQWALDVRNSAPEYIDDPELLIKFHKQVDADLDQWRNEINEEGKTAVEWTGGVAKDVGMSLLATPPAMAGLAEGAIEAVGQTGDDFDPDNKSLQMAGEGVLAFIVRGRKWAKDKVANLSDNDRNQFIQGYENEIKQLEEFVSNRDAIASSSPEAFKNKVELHLNELRFKSQLLLGEKGEDLVDIVPDDPKESALNQENAALISRYMQTRNRGYLEALYKNLGRSKEEDALIKTQKESKGIVRSSTKALASVIGEKFAEELDQTATGLISDPIDLGSMLFSLGMGRAVVAASGKGLGVKAKKAAAAAGVESGQEALSAIGSGEDPLEAGAQGAAGGLMFAGVGGSMKLAKDAYQNRLKKKASEVLDDDFDFDLESSIPDEEGPSDGLLAPEEDGVIDEIGEIADIDDSSFMESFKGAKATVFGGLKDKKYDSGTNDKGEKTGPGGREGVSLRRSIQERIFGENFKENRENYAVRIKLPDGGYKDYDIVDHGPAEEIIEREGREVLDLTEGVAAELGIDITRDEAGNIAGNTPTNLDFDIVQKETKAPLHLNEQNLDGWTVADQEAGTVSFPKTETGAMARAVYENIQDSVNGYIDADVDGLSVSTGSVNRKWANNKTNELFGAVKNLESQDRNVVEAAEKTIKQFFGQRKKSELTKTGRARSPKDLFESYRPDIETKEAAPVAKPEATQQQPKKETAPTTPAEPALTRDEIAQRAKSRPELEGLTIGERTKKTQELTDASGKIIDADIDAIIRDILSRREINPASNISEEVDRLQQKLESLDENNPKNIEAREQVLDALSDYLLLENIDPNRLSSIKKETTAAEENIQKASGILGGVIDQVRASRAGRNIASNRGIDPAIDMRIDDLAGRQAPPSSTQGVVTRREAELGGVPFEPVITEGEAGRAREAARTKPLSSGELTKARPLFDVTADPKKRKFVNDLQRDAREMIRNNMLTGESVDIGLVNELSRDLSEAIYRHMPDVKMEDFQKLIRLPEVQDHLNEQAQVAAVGPAPLPTINSLRPAIQRAFPDKSPSFINRAINAILDFLNKIKQSITRQIQDETGSVNPSGKPKKKSFTTSKQETETGLQKESRKRPADPLMKDVNKQRSEILKKLPKKSFAQIDLYNDLSGISVNRLSNLHLNELQALMKSIESKAPINSILPDVKKLKELSKDGIPRDAGTNAIATGLQDEAMKDLRSWLRNIVPTMPENLQGIAVDAYTNIQQTDTSKMDLRQLNRHTTKINDLISGKPGVMGELASSQKIQEFNVGVNTLGGFHNFFKGNPKLGWIWGITASMPSRIRAIFSSPTAQRVHELGYGDIHTGITNFERRSLDARDRAEAFYKRYKITAEENTRAYLAGLLTQWEDGSKKTITEQFNKIKDDVQKGIDFLKNTGETKFEIIARTHQRHLDDMLSGSDPDMSAKEYEKFIYSKLSNKEKRFLDFMRKESAKTLDELKWVTENVIGEEFTKYRNYIHRDASMVGQSETATDLESEHLDYRIQGTGEKSKVALGGETGVSIARTGLAESQYYNLDGLSSLLNGTKKAYYTIETAYGRKVVKKLHLNEAYINGLGRNRVKELDHIYKSIHSSFLGDRLGSTIPLAILRQLSSNLASVKLASIKNLGAQSLALLEGIVRLGPTGNAAFRHAMSNLGQKDFDALIHDLAPQVKERLRQGDVAFERVSTGSMAAQFMRALQQDAKHDLRSKVINYGANVLKAGDTVFAPVRTFSKFVNLRPESIVLKTLWTAGYIQDLIDNGVIKKATEFDPKVHNREIHSANRALRFAESTLGNPTSIAMRAELFKSNSTGRRLLADGPFKFTQSMNGLAHEQTNDISNITGGLMDIAAGRGSKDTREMVYESMKATMGRMMQVTMFSATSALINSYLISPIFASIFLDNDDLDSDEQKMYRKVVRLNKEAMVSEKQLMQNAYLEMARTLIPVFNNSFGDAFLSIGYDKTIGALAVENEKKLVAGLVDELKEAKKMLENGEISEEKVAGLEFALDLHRELRDRKAFFRSPDNPVDGYGSIEFLYDYTFKNSALDALNPGDLTNEAHVRAMNLITGLGVTNPDIERHKRLAKKFVKAAEKKREKKKEREEKNK